MIGQTNKTYLEAASRELNYVVSVAPRAWNGAISQRYNTPEVWADFMYMVPPFLAYSAVATANTSLLRLAIQQCGLYRQILQADMTITAQKNMQGVWKHIIGPNDYQPGLWSTGNGWAAAGMTRVLATTLKWEKSASWAHEQGLLTQWIKEIIDGTMEGSLTSTEPSTGLLRNYLNDTSWFGETSGTALMSSVAYRMMVLVPEIFAEESRYVTWAENLRISVTAHFKTNGTFSPAVNPLNWSDHTPFTTGSPEGQSFGVLLAAAYRDWICTP
jgi:rhamnogalacturonyl hydrolase YesR